MYEIIGQLYSKCEYIMKSGFNKKNAPNAQKASITQDIIQQDHTGESTAFKDSELVDGCGLIRYKDAVLPV